MTISLSLIWHMLKKSYSVIMRLSGALNFCAKSRPAFRKNDCVCVGVGWGVGGTSSCCSRKDLWVSPFHSFYCLSFPVSWPSDLCRSHVPDSSLSRRPINRWIRLYPDWIPTPCASSSCKERVCTFECWWRKGGSACVSLHLQGMV